MFDTANILPILIAGLINGSFVVPTKYVKNIVNEKVWFYHSIIGLMIIPWVLLALMMPEVVRNYLLLQPKVFIFLIFGGVVFGLGQVCFAYAIKSIGIALSFVINLGIGVTIGSMFLVFYKTSIFTSQNYFVTLAVVLIVCSLVVYYFSAKNNHQEHLNAHYHRGWLLASLAGIASGFQNIVFVVVAFHTSTQFQTNNSYWVWPPFLLAAAIPMMLGFYYRMKQEHLSDEQASFILKIKNLFLITVMGLCFTGSLVLYSNGMNKLTTQQQVIGWPTFMIAIIMTSQAWGFFYKESNGSNIKYKILSTFLLITAIVVLSLKG